VKKKCPSLSLRSITPKLKRSCRPLNLEQGAAPEKATVCSVLERRQLKKKVERKKMKGNGMGIREFIKGHYRRLTAQNMGSGRREKRNRMERKGEGQERAG